jgi:hypothetical protein
VVINFIHFPHSLLDKLYIHICIFLVCDGTFVSFGLRQRKKTAEGDVGEKNWRRRRRERCGRGKKNIHKRTCGGGGEGERKK